MAQQATEVTTGTESDRTVSEGERWRFDMADAAQTTEEERQKASRMFGEMFVAFSATVVEVEDDCVTLSVLTSNAHKSAPEAGASVVRLADVMLDRAEWTRLGDA